MVLHTLVVDPLRAGKGCGTRFVRFYEDYALERGCPYLRMDTNARNAAARRLYAHLGYRDRTSKQRTDCRSAVLCVSPQR